MWSFRGQSSSSRLCRPDVRKGSAFPAVGQSEFSEATPRSEMRGLPPQSKTNSPPERQSLSAHPRGRAASLPVILLVASGLLLTTSCRRDMQDQPKAIAYRENSFYKDGSGSRPLVDGTVPRGYLREDREYYFGKKANAPVNASAATQTAATSATALYPDDVETFPIPIDKAAIDRGQDRYNIYCSVCHGMTGYGDGIVMRRGFNKPAPASYHQERLRQAPVGHFFDVITNGWGAMPSYASQVPVEDRWKIIAYLRALQLSQTPAGTTGNNAVPTPSPKEGAQHQ
jgi:mono/diheme cytochrome c family protein